MMPVVKTVNLSYKETYSFNPNFATQVHRVSFDLKMPNIIANNIT